MIANALPLIQLLCSVVARGAGLQVNMKHLAPTRVVSGPGMSARRLEGQALDLFLILETAQGRLLSMLFPHEARRFGHGLCWKV